MLMLIIGFCVGLIVGSIGIGMWGAYIGNKLRTQILNTIEAMEQEKKPSAGSTAKASQKTTMSSVQKELILKTLREAAEIAKIQMEMLSQIDAPSKNALHSKYKNGLISEIQELETQKMALLKQVLDSGFDPTITVMNDEGVLEEQLLSDYFNSPHGVVPPVKEKPVRKLGKFTLFKGGKDDGKGH